MKSLLALFLAAAFGLADTPAINELHVFPLSGDQRTFPEGSGPGPIIQASDGDYYGVTQSGGDDAVHCQSHGCGGTIFQIAAAGDFKVLYTFAWGSATAPYANGWHPLRLVEGQDGFLYGTTFAGGVAGRLKVGISGRC